MRQSMSEKRRGGGAVVAATVAAVLLHGAGAAGAQEAPHEADAVWEHLQTLDGAERQEVLEREARKEGKLLLYGATGIDRATFWIEQFNSRYPDIEVEFIRLQAADLVEKLTL